MIRKAVALFSALIALALGYLVLESCCAPQKIEPLRPSAGRLVIDEHLELARTYAPVVCHEFHPKLGRQDVPAPVDFDGDLRGPGNWDAFLRHELLPTLYYAVLETETHVFISYHLFHPRDWTLVDLRLHLTHENDGENLQVVVEKASGLPVLLFTQAHYRGAAYAAQDSGFGSGSERLRGDFLRFDGDWKPSREGRHACVFVESGGHGIIGVPDRRAGVEIAPDGTASFDRAGWVLRPARAGEVVSEPPLESGRLVAYQLESLTKKLWPLLASGELVGEGKLLDRTVGYRDARVEVEVPRYYEADRFSGPLGPDRGISPFALDFGFKQGELGALFFDPARRYAEVLKVPEPWSVEYEDYPFD